MAFTKTLAEMEQSVPDSGARKRIAAFLDENSFVEADKFLSAEGEQSSVVVGSGTVEGISVFVFAQDTEVRGGAVDKYAAMKLKRTYEHAAKAGAPVVGFYDSKGGDIAEGAGVLADYAEIIASSAKLSGVVPQIAVITGVCAGCAAMLAATADIVIATEKSELFLTAPFNNADGKLAGAGTAENAAKSGVCQIVAKDGDDAVKKAKMLLAMLPANNLSAPYCLIDAEPSDGVISAGLKGMELVKAFADKGLAVELGEKFGSAAVTALAPINATTTAFVTTDKAEKLTADDCAKIARFVEFADAFSLPVVTVINTEGFAGSSAAELAGSIRTCARLAQVYANATTVKINLITGKAVGAAAVSFAGADVTIAYENAFISPMNEQAIATFAGDVDTSVFAAASAGFADAVISAENAYTEVFNNILIYQNKRVQRLPRKHANFSL